VLRHIVNDYVDEPNLEKVRVGALKGLADGLDPYSAYLTPDQVKRFKADTMRKTPFGMTLSKYAGFAYVVSVVKGSPADTAGIKTGDILEYIGTTASRDVSLYDIQETLVNVPAGGDIEVTILKRDKSDKVKLKNANFASPLESRMEDGDIGYIKVGLLTAGKSGEVKTAVQQLTQKGAKKIVLDLRGSSFGELAEGVAVANLFVSNGLLARTIGHNNQIKTFEAEMAKTIFTGTLTVLTDRSTSGPAEIVAAAVANGKRGEIVGERTFGAGSDQELFSLKDGSGMLLTVSRYAPGVGKPFMEENIKPTVEVKVAEAEPAVPEVDGEGTANPDTPKEEKKVTPTTEDVILKKALELLKNNGKQTARAKAAQAGRAVNG
jgi:carboxyl-terminal processing protease